MSVNIAASKTAQFAIDPMVFSNVAGHDDTFVTLLTEDNEHQEARFLTVPRTIDRLEQIFDGKEGRPHINDLPLPRSRNEPGKPPITNNPAIITIKNAKGKDATMNWWIEGMKHVPLYAEWSQKLEALKDAKAGKAEADPVLVSLGEPRQDSEIAKYTKRLQTALQTVENSMLCRHLMNRINDELPALECNFIEDNGALRNTPKPIIVFDKDIKKHLSSVYTIGGFLRFDVDKAKAAGGTYAALMGSVRRETEPGSTKLNFEKPAEAHDAVLALVKFFANNAKRAATVKMLNPLKVETDEQRDILYHEREAWVEAKQEIDAIVGFFMKQHGEDRRKRERDAA